VATYTSRYDELSDRQKFHFASRLYLCQQLPQAAAWLAELRPAYTGNEQPLPVVRALLAQPVPDLPQTASHRQPYFDKYPKLRQYERVLVRLLFLQVLYGYESRKLIYEVLPEPEMHKLHQALLADQPVRMLFLHALHYC